MTKEFSIWKLLLHDAALSLSSSRNIPIRLRPLCRSLGVASIERSNLEAAASLLIDASSNPKIVINSSRVGTGRAKETFTPWERFLIAHELGHLVLYRNNVPSPNGTSEYWKIEALCDDFAQRLLIPDLVIKEKVAGGTKDVIKYLALVLDIAGLTLVPWFIAAPRLASCDSKVSFFRLTKHEEGGYKVVLSTLKSKQGIRQRIKPGTQLWEVFSKIDPNQKVTVIKGSQLRGFASLETIDECAACSTHDEIRLVVSHMPIAA